MLLSYVGIYYKDENAAYIDPRRHIVDDRGTTNRSGAEQWRAQTVGQGCEKIGGLKMYFVCKNPKTT